MAPCFLHPAFPTEDYDLVDRITVEITVPLNSSQREFCAAWAWVLHLYTGQDEVCFRIGNLSSAICNVADIITVQDLVNSVKISSAGTVPDCNTALHFEGEPGATEGRSTKVIP